MKYSNGTEVEGIDELIKKLDYLPETLEECSKVALKSTAKEVYNEIIKYTPVSEVREIHGIDAMKVARNVKKFPNKLMIQTGLNEALRGNGSGVDYWEQIRGLWFQNFKTDEPNYGWWDKFIKSKREIFKKNLSKKLEKEIKKVLK